MAIKSILSDLDGTLIQYKNSPFHSSWDALGFVAGLDNEFKKNLEYYFPKKELYKEWVKKNVELLKGKSLEEIKKRIFPLLPYSPGAEELFKNLDNSFIKGIISNGVDFVAEKVGSLILIFI